MTRKEKWETWAKEWDNKLPNLAKALRSESLQKSCDEIDQLVWLTRIEERKLIRYVTESALADDIFSEEYKKALEDEILNHNAAIEENEQELNKLKNE